MEFSIKDSVIHLYNIENDLETIRHSRKRLEMLLSLSRTDGIALQSGGFITVALRDYNTSDMTIVSSIEIEDKSYKIYPVVLARLSDDNTSDNISDNISDHILDTFDEINNYCKEQINFLIDYSLPIFSDDVNSLFNSVVDAVVKTPYKNKTRRLLKILELYILRKHIQDIIMSKTHTKEETEAAFTRKLNGYLNGSITHRGQ